MGPRKKTGPSQARTHKHPDLKRRMGSAWQTLLALVSNVGEKKRRLELLQEADLRIGSVVIDCINFDEMLAFWQEALHYVPWDPASGGWVVLRILREETLRMCL